MTQVSASKANWAVEVFLDGKPSEFYSIDALIARSDHVMIRTTDGKELRFGRGNTPKVVLLRTTN